MKGSEGQGWHPWDTGVLVVSGRLGDFKGDLRLGLSTIPVCSGVRGFLICDIFSAKTRRK